MSGTEEGSGQGSVEEKKGKLSKAERDKAKAIKAALQEALQQAEFKSYVESLVELFQGLLKLNQYRFVLLFEGDKEFSDHFVFTDDDRAEIAINAKYLWAHVGFGKNLRKQFDEKKWYEVALVVCHELSHVIFNEYQNLPFLVEKCSVQDARLLGEIEERHTSLLSHIILDLLPETYFTPTKYL